MAGNLLGQNRSLFLKTPLGENKLLIASFTGREAISEPFHFHLEMISEDPKIAFQDLIGKKVTFGLMGENEAPALTLNGVVVSLTQLPSSFRIARYHADVSPSFELLKLRQDCRIFQNQSVLDILKVVLQGLDVDYRTTGSYTPREYCVQYRESDFNFASRLMEEEGIFYFFTHAENSHKLVIADASSAHRDIPGDARLVFDEVEGATPEDETVRAWEKTQSISSYRIHLRDYAFQKPQTGTDASEQILGSPVSVGAVSHSMTAISDPFLEVYDYPGGYTKDGAFELSKGQQVAKTLAEGLERSQFLIRGKSDIGRLISGFKFTLDRHPNANGPYVLTSVSHEATEGDFFSQSGENPSSYQNEFTCLPATVNFRPPNVTPRPIVHGCHTATVVGKAGEEIWTDKYGRIKVHFHWDRLDSWNESSSCWIRVATPWAGNLWGMIHTPRIGQEVVVDFLEGDPDRPLVVGSVYNAANMPPWTLPAESTKSGLKTKSTLKGASENFNQIMFEDKKGSELLGIQAEKDMELLVKKDRREEIDQDSHLTVKRDLIEEIQRDWTYKTGRDLVTEVARDLNTKIKGKSAVEITGSESVKVTGNAAAKYSQNYAADAGINIYIKAGATVVIEAGAGISLKAGSGFINVDAAGVTISGAMVLINSGGAALSGTAGSIVAPTGVKAPAIPGTGAVDGSTAAGAGAAVAAGVAAGAAAASSAPSHNPNDDKNKDKTHWVEVEFIDDAGQPLPGVSYEVKLPDGSVSSGTTDEKGVGKITNIDPGNCEISFPNLDQDAWEEA
ncbi:MAG: type VI secretion system tip protein VgrG [Bryobacterales bacterium]|nr:type VI secretion system tip protein VgrG [Bryobacterales bacterium]